MRFDVHWAQIAKRKPRTQRDPNDPAYQWAQADNVIAHAAALGFPVLATIAPHAALGRRRRGTTRRRANMKRSENFSYAAAMRYSGKFTTPDGPAAAARRALHGLERAEHERAPHAAVDAQGRQAGPGLAGDLREAAQGASTRASRPARSRRPTR